MFLVSLIIDNQLCAEINKPKTSLQSSEETQSSQFPY